MPLLLAMILLFEFIRPQGLTSDPTWHARFEYVAWCQNSRISSATKENLPRENANSSFNWWRMNWPASDLSKEWEQFYQQCVFTVRGPLSKCTKKEKVCNLMSFVSNKGRKIFYLTFQWQTVQVGAGEDKKDINEKVIPKRVAGKFKAHLDAACAMTMPCTADWYMYQVLSSH